ncbi:MAG TPA: CNNM domain-containing protein, partial [Candidatus Bipolaricaulota bacterium]
MDIGWGIVLLLILIGSSAVLSTTEIAVASMEKIRLSVLIRSHPRKARALQVLMDDPNSLITTVAIVNNFANILASSIATILAIQLLGALSATEAGLIATVLMTVFLLIFGEITPKNFGKNNPEFLTLLLIGPLVALRNALGPLSFLFKSASDALLFLLPKNLRERESVTVSEDHITMLLELGQGKGLIEEEEVDMIRRIFAFDDLAARQVMVSRVDVVSIEAATSFEQARQIAIAEEHSRYPVYEEKPDN